MKQTITLFFGILIMFSAGSCKTDSKKETLTLADASVVWWMAPSLVAQKDSIYQKNDLNINSFDVQTGLASMNAVISGSADIGLVATAPLAMAGFRKENLVILGSYVESNSLLSLITPKSNDSINFSQPIEPLAIVKGTISELYFYNYMQKYYPNIDLKSINQLAVKPPDVGNAMGKGSAKSASIWEPFGTMIASANPNLQINRADDIYTLKMYIIVKPETLKNKKEAIDKFMKSINDACIKLNAQDNYTKKIVLDAFPAQKLSMNTLWNKVDFSLKYDFENMEKLILSEAQTLFELGYTPKDEQEKLRQLNSSDIEQYFSHQYQLNK